MKTHGAAKGSASVDESHSIYDREPVQRQNAVLVRKRTYGRGVTIVRIAGAKPLAACGGRVSAIGYFCGAAGGPAGAVAVPGVGTTTPGASGSSSTAVTRVT